MVALNSKCSVLNAVENEKIHHHHDMEENRAVGSMTGYLVNIHHWRDTRAMKFNLFKPLFRL